MAETSITYITAVLSGLAAGIYIFRTLIRWRETPKRMVTHANPKATKTCSHDAKKAS